jgi:hypothetical protein
MASEQVFDRPAHPALHKSNLSPVLTGGVIVLPGAHVSVPNIHPPCLRGSLAAHEGAPVPTPSPRSSKHRERSQADIERRDRHLGALHLLAQVTNWERRVH